MAKLYGNTGTEVTPIWTEITDTARLWFTGLGSTAGLSKPVIRPSNGFAYNEEWWIAPEVYAGAQKINWTKPSAATQLGKIFKVVFTESLVSAPFITAFDDAADGNVVQTYIKDILSGTEETNWTGMIKCFCTNKESVNTPPAVGWATQKTGSAGSANPNALQGTSQLVTVPFIPTVGGDFTFTLAVTIPSDAQGGKVDIYDPILTIVFVHL